MATGQWYKDYAAVQRRTPAGAGGASWAAYLKAKNATSEGYETAFKELDIAARQEGVTVNRPAMTAGMSQAQYQEVLQKYLVNINDEVLKKNVTAALKDIQSQGAVAGAHVQLPSLANLTSANAQSVVNSYIDIVNQTVAKNYVNMSLSDLRAQGIANGVNVPIPAVSNTVSQAQAQEIVNKYQSQVNSALLVKSTQDALKSVQSQAKSYGVNVAVPTISAGITEQAANALVDRYAADVNAKLSSVTVSESKPASNNQIQISSKVNNALVGSTVTAPSVSIARNSDGSLAVNEGLYNQLKAAQAQHKSWWNDYSGIPQQVIDSRATDVRINSKGQFEWTPVTAADKAQLDKINVQRTRSGLAPRTTLIHGPEKSTEYNTKWLSTTGSGSRGTGEAGVKIKDASGKTVKSYDYNTANLAKVGSGDIKIASVKAGSSVNANATAKTNTAQDVKAVKITQKELNAKLAAAHPGQIQLKDGSWINQIEKVGNNSTKEAVTLYSSKAERNAIIETQKQAALKANAAAAKALANYTPIYDIKGKVVEGISVKSKQNEGEKKVTYVSGDFRKSAQAFNIEKKAAIQNAAIQITSETSKKDKKIILNAREYLKTHNMNADLASTKLSKGATQFKTVDQTNYEKALKSDLPFFALSAKLNKQFSEALSYKNVTSKASAKLNKLNRSVSEKLNLASLDDIEKIRDEKLSGITVKVTQPGKVKREYTLKDVQSKGQDKLYANKYGKALMDETYDTIDAVRVKPVSAAAGVAALYATGAIAGVVIEGGLGAVAGTAGKVALKSGKIGKAAGYVSKYAQPVGRGALGASVAYEGGKTVLSGDAVATVKFMESLAVGGMGYSKGARIVKDPISIIPGVKTIKLQEVTAGHSTNVKDIRVGETFSIGGKSIISRSSNGKLTRGYPKLNSELTKTLNSKGKLEDKIIQSFDKDSNKAFEVAVKNISGEKDALLYKSGKVISDTAYSMKKPVTVPKKFEITSEHISPEMKSSVKNAIFSFGKLKGERIEVYGSVAQKAQMEGFFSRTPQDLEVSVSSVDKFISMFKLKATKAGFKEGVDFRITKAEADAPKIEFKLDGKWKKGVEVFSSKSGVTKELPGYRSEDGIAFGYKKLGLLKVEDAKIMKLQEQASRKFAGATTLQGGEIKPVHPGRIKDVRDLIEIGVANEITFKTGIAKDIIQYAKLYAAKDASVKESPVAEYLISANKFPVKSDVGVLTSKTLRKPEKLQIIKRTGTLRDGLKGLNDVVSNAKSTQNNLVAKTSYRALKRSSSKKDQVTLNSAKSKSGNAVTKNAQAKFRQQLKAKSNERELLYTRDSKSKFKNLKDLVEKSKITSTSKASKTVAAGHSLAISGSKASKPTNAKAIGSKVDTKSTKELSKALTNSNSVKQPSSSKSISNPSKISNKVAQNSTPSKASREVSKKSVDKSKIVQSSSKPSKQSASKPSVSKQSIRPRSVSTKVVKSKKSVSNAGSSSVGFEFKKSSTSKPAEGKQKYKDIRDRKRKLKDEVKLMRKIKNRLGSMKTIF